MNITTGSKRRKQSGLVLIALLVLIAAGTYFLVKDVDDANAGAGIVQTR